MIRSRLFAAVLSLSALSVPLWSAQPALANKPLQVQTEDLHFGCSDVRTADGVVQIAASDFSEFNEADASINYWVPPETPENAPDSTYRSSSLITDQHVTRTGNHFEGTLLMEDRDFNPVGTASFSVDLIPTTEVMDVGEKSRFGNRNIHDKSTLQFFSVSGSVTLHDGKVFNLTNCIGPDGAPSDHAGANLITDFRVTDPSQFVISFSGVLVICDVTTEDYFMNLGASNENGPDVSLFFSDDVTSLFGSSEDVILTAEEFSGSIPLANDETGEPAGDAVLDVTFTRGEHTVIRVQDGSIRSNQEGFILQPTGTLTFPNGTVVDMSSCFAFDGREQQKEHRPRE